MVRWIFEVKKIIQFVKKETVLTVAWVLALVSVFIVPPSKDYLGYIDLRSMGILWSLMVIMAALKENGLFEAIAEKLLEKTKVVWQLAAVLIFLCFFMSMLITNDVALITFVPFAIYILSKCNKKELMIPIIAFQTVAANLGSMLTPIGNPQNLYLYEESGMSVMEFIGLLAPYTLITFVLLVLSIMLIKGKKEEVIDDDPIKEKDTTGWATRRKKIAIYGIVFALSLCVVAHYVPYWVLIAVVLIVTFILDKKMLVSIDYALLFTFLGFFIFTGNLGRVEYVRNVLTELVGGREVGVGIIASQFISNVPAALLLSSFTENIPGLILGVNFGGLGTLIASMASLISFKLLAHNYNELKGKYFIYFTVVNVVYLLFLVLGYVIIH